MDGLSHRELLRLRRSEAREAQLQEKAKAQVERDAKKEVRAAEQSRELLEHVKKCSWLHSMDEAPVYRPTPQEFEDPMAYIQSISAEASKFGICKIVPPVFASTSCFKALKLNLKIKSEKGKDTFKFGTRQQVVRDSPWDDFGRTRFWTAPQLRSLTKFSEMADSIANKTFQSSVLQPGRRIEVRSARRCAAWPVSGCPHAGVACPRQPSSPWHSYDRQTASQGPASPALNCYQFAMRDVGSLAAALRPVASRTQKRRMQSLTSRCAIQARRAGVHWGRSDGTLALRLQLFALSHSSPTVPT